MSRTARGSTVVDRYEGMRLNSPNDIVVATDGAIWFTDPPYGILDDNEGYKADSELAACYVFRLDRSSGELTVVTDALDAPERPRLLTRRVDTLRLGHVAGPDRGRQPSHHGVRRHRRPTAGVAAGLRGHRSRSVGRIAGRRRRERLDLGRRRDPGLRRRRDRAGPDPARPRSPATAPSAGPDGRRLFITATSTLWSIDVGIRGAVTPWVEASG